MEHSGLKEETDPKKAKEYLEMVKEEMQKVLSGESTKEEGIERLRDLAL